MIGSSQMADMVNEGRSLLGGDEQHPHRFHPRTVQALITRVVALTLELIPIEVEENDITSPTSSIITKPTSQIYLDAAGDFSLALPFALLEARRYFRIQARLNPSDADENQSRMWACEALARKLVAYTPLKEQYRLLSARFTVLDDDGDETLPTSALESAVDQQCTFFLSSNEAQRCVFALWKGLLVQTEKEGGQIDYELYSNANGTSTYDHFDPQRLSVPRYQFFFRIVLWIVFVVAYTWAIQTPERGFGFEDVVLYVQAAGYLLEDLIKLYKLGVWPALNFWLGVNFLIYALLAIAFGYRVKDLTIDHHAGESTEWRMRSFQWLSCAAPLVWMKLLPSFDIYPWVGTLQICFWRMLKETGAFMTLLAVLAVGFGQGLSGLDVADDHRNQTTTVIHSLLQALLGSPTFDSYEENPFQMALYYGWSILTLILLLNILVALFNSAYEDCVEEAIDVFMAFFSAKTVSAIRAPDTYVFVAPFNLVELAILPLEYVLSRRAYARLNRVLLGGLFLVPLAAIAVWETHFDRDRAKDFAELSQEAPEFERGELDPEAWGQSDELGKRDEGVLTRVPFEQLKGRLPDIKESGTTMILAELKKLRGELDEMRKERR